MHTEVDLYETHPFPARGADCLRSAAVEKRGRATPANCRGDDTFGRGIQRSDEAGHSRSC